jgi:hypothetical protein
MAISVRTFVKPAKHAALMGAGFIVAGLVYDGETKRLFMGGLFALITFAGGVIAEWWRPTQPENGPASPTQRQP